MVQHNIAVVSDCFLTSLTKLSKSIFLIVSDEIITGGRYGQMIYTTIKSQECIGHVAFIYPGKWMGMSIVIFSQKCLNVIGSRNTSETIGPTFKENLAAFNNMLPYLDNAGNVRREVLSKLKMNDEKSWGEEILT